MFKKHDTLIPSDFEWGKKKMQYVVQINTKTFVSRCKHWISDYATLLMHDLLCQKL
jgi:ribosomal protein S17E